MSKEYVPKEKYDVVRKLAVLLAAEMHKANGLLRPAKEHIQRLPGHVNIGNFPGTDVDMWCFLAREWLTSYLEFEGATADLDDRSAKEGVTMSTLIETVFTEWGDVPITQFSSPARGAVEDRRCIKIGDDVRLARDDVKRLVECLQDWLLPLEETFDRF